MQPVKLVSGGSQTATPLLLQALGHVLNVRCLAKPDICQALHTAFAGISFDPISGQTGQEYIVTETDTGFMLEGGASEVLAEDLGALIYHLDKNLTLSLQQVRKDLCFIHAGAVMAPDGRVIILTASSGSGKSTMTWALLHHGFGYLSDELAPIDPGTLEVHGFPHALCLKHYPPDPYKLPEATLVTTRTMHVPVASAHTHGKLAAIFFVNHQHPEDHPVLAEVSPARAAMYLYANTLNPLAHPNEGLDAIAAIAQSVPSYYLNSSNLGAACHTVRKLFAAPP